MATKTTGEANLWLPVMADTIPVTVEVHLKENFETIDEKITELSELRIHTGTSAPTNTNFWYDPADNSGVTRR